MKHLDLTLPSPAENLAADEVLLDWCEAGASEEILRFWEPHATFVVVGYANKVETEVNVTACAQKKVPIFRRCSGGGTIVQMAGGLNYSLILRIDENGPTRNITTANQFIMERNRQAIEAGFRRQNSEAEIFVRGHTDLTFVTDRSSLITEKKFAGNAQRRRKNFLLFHGTLLLNCDLTLVSELLLMPSLQPDYRASRSHAEFVANLSLSAAAVKTALIRGWNAGEVLQHSPHEAVTILAREKYVTPEWNFKF